MAKQTFPRDRFDDVPENPARLGAHRTENPRMRGGIVFLWAALATVVLVVAGVFGTMLIGGRLSLFPDSAATPTPVATTVPVVDTSYSVLVLNATGQAGLAAGVKQDVVGAGWSADKVYIADASTRDFAKTTVYYADPADEGAARGLAAAIGGAEVIESAQYRTDATIKQLTIVVGQDRVATPAS